MSSNETEVALLRQRVEFLEADEQRQRNWKMRVYGWIIGPTIMLFVAGLTLYGQVQKLEYKISVLQETVADKQKQINKLYDIVANYPKKKN